MLKSGVLIQCPQKGVFCKQYRAQITIMRFIIHLVDMV